MFYKSLVGFPAILATVATATQYQPVDLDDAPGSVSVVHDQNSVTFKSDGCSTKLILPIPHKFESLKEVLEEFGREYVSKCYSPDTPHPPEEDSGVSTETSEVTSTSSNMGIQCVFGERVFATYSLARRSGRPFHDDRVENGLCVELLSALRALSALILPIAEQRMSEDEKNQCLIQYHEHLLQIECFDLRNFRVRKSHGVPEGELVPNQKTRVGVYDIAVSEDREGRTVVNCAFNPSTTGVGESKYFATYAITKSSKLNPALMTEHTCRRCWNPIWYFDKLPVKAANPRVSSVVAHEICRQAELSIVEVKHTGKLTEGEKNMQLFSGKNMKKEDCSIQFALPKEKAVGELPKYSFGACIDPTVEIPSAVIGKLPVIHATPPSKGFKRSGVNCYVAKASGQQSIDRFATYSSSDLVKFKMATFTLSSSKITTRLLGEYENVIPQVQTRVCQLLYLRYLEIENAAASPSKDAKCTITRDGKDISTTSCVDPLTPLPKTLPPDIKNVEAKPLSSEKIQCKLSGKDAKTLTYGSSESLADPFALWKYKFSAAKVWGYDDTITREIVYPPTSSGTQPAMFVGNGVMKRVCQLIFLYRRDIFETQTPSGKSGAEAGTQVDQGGNTDTDESGSDSGEEVAELSDTEGAGRESRASTAAWRKSISLSDRDSELSRASFVSGSSVMSSDGESFADRNAKMSKPGFIRSLMPGRSKKTGL